MSGTDIPASSVQSAVIDLTGQTFGSVRVVCRAENKKYRECSWTIQCTLCGRTYPRPIRGSTLRGGKVTGKKCPGCRPQRPDAPLIVVDRQFVEHWTPLIHTSIGKVLGFGNRYSQSRDDLTQEVLTSLSQKKASVPEQAMSSFVWSIAKYVAINFVKHQATAKHHPTVAGTDELYQVVLDSLTTDEEPLCFDHKLIAMKEAFDSLTEKDRDFCAAYFADTKFKSGLDERRMAYIRERLNRRLTEIQEQAVHGAA